MTEGAAIETGPCSYPCPNPKSCPNRARIRLRVGYSAGAYSYPRELTERTALSGTYYVGCRARLSVGYIYSDYPSEKIPRGYTNNRAPQVHLLVVELAGQVFVSFARIFAFSYFVFRQTPAPGASGVVAGHLFLSIESILTYRLGHCGSHC